MATVVARQSNGAGIWGLALLTVMCVMLVVSGAWLYFAVGSAPVFEQDTGVSLREFEAAYPTVAPVMAKRGQYTGLLLGALGLYALIVTLSGLRSGSSWAWNANWILVVVLAAIAASALIAENWTIGLAYATYVALGISGQLLVRSSLRQL